LLAEFLAGARRAEDLMPQLGRFMAGDKGQPADVRKFQPRRGEEVRRSRKGNSNKNSTWRSSRSQSSISLSCMI
jgi:hypothetical protein